MSDDVMMTAAARKILISSRFDVTQVRIKSVRGVITMQGRFEKMAGEKVTMDQMLGTLKRMDDSLRSLKGFRGAAFMLDNWARESTGTWTFKGSRSEKEELTGKKG